MIIQLLVDNSNSWIMPYAKELQGTLQGQGYQTTLIHEHDKIKQGTVLVLLSCEKILKDLSLNEYNLVIHESNLPKGKGWSPLTWQVLEGQREIPITLFEAAEKVDAGVIYYRDIIQLEGHELVEELRDKQGKKTIELVLRFVHDYPNIKREKQKGESTYYKKRTPKDSALDIQKTLEEQFNLLRVCDNERYPAYFKMNGYKYKLKIEKEL